MVYKIRVVLDAKENIFRDIEIKEKQTLWNLHLGIKSAFSLQGDELSAFNLLEDDGTVIKSIPMEDMSDEGDGEIMSDIYLSEAFEKIGDKAQFQYGLLDLWEFFCELIEESQEKPSVNYPITVFRYGNVPMKAPQKKISSSKGMPFADLGFDDEIPELDSEGDYTDEDEDFEAEDDYNDDFFDDKEPFEEE